MSVFSQSVMKNDNMTYTLFDFAWLIFINHTYYFICVNSNLFYRIVFNEMQLSRFALKFNSSRFIILNYSLISRIIQMCLQFERFSSYPPRPFFTLELVHLLTSNEVQFRMFHFVIWVLIKNHSLR